LVGCPLVDYVGLRFLENRCPLLQVKYFIIGLNILHITWLTLVIINCNVNCVIFKGLQVIDVSRCDLVSSSGLMSVVRGHSGLLQLNAGYSFSVSEFHSSLVHVSGFTDFSFF
jgi:F-box/leucine-rich repeat protein 2/20